MTKNRNANNTGPPGSLIRSLTPPWRGIFRASVEHSMKHLSTTSWLSTMSVAHYRYMTAVYLEDMLAELNRKPATDLTSESGHRISAHYLCRMAAVNFAMAIMTRKKATS